jgi:imidazolonepropionase-like amidohydrolase
MTEQEAFWIQADIVIPGRGAPVRDGVVVLEGARIAYAGPRAGAPQPSVPVTKVRAVMPGMWDCHAHFFGMREFDLDRFVTEPQPLLVARATTSAQAVLRAGFTSVRELGGFGVFLARAVIEGTLDGPAIYGAGSILSQTGGHADAHGLPLTLLQDHATHGGGFQLCDGIAECQKAVRLQLRKNARVIKICASGGVASQVDDPSHQQFSDDELRAIVDEAGRADRVVAAHCHGKAGIMAALRAGCRTIEHGSYLDEEAAAAMREAGALLVSTRTMAARALGAIDRVQPYIAAKMRAIADSHFQAMQIARAAGVRIAAGSDLVTSGPGSLAPQGANGEELVHLVAAGHTPLEAIEAATANAPLTLGPQAPRSGLLGEGFDADLIALDVDPLEAISALAQPAHITHVWKSGRMVKTPAS